MFNTIKRMFCSHKDNSKCPECGGKMWEPNVIEHSILLGDYIPKIRICENHINAKRYMIIEGNGTCSYSLGDNLRDAVSRDWVVLRKNRVIEEGDYILLTRDDGYLGQPHIVTATSNYFKASPIGKAVWEVACTLAFRPYIPKEETICSK